jgi:hypothetical protein
MFYEIIDISRDHPNLQKSLLGTLTREEKGAVEPLLFGR